MLYSECGSWMDWQKMNDCGCAMDKKEEQLGEDHAAIIYHQRCLLPMI
jgi:hypothetical protein